MKFFIKTFGCRLNFAESSELQEKIKKYLDHTESEKNSDIVIIRACSVTHGAEQGVRQTIRKYKRAGKTVYVLGCFREQIFEADKYFKNDNALIKFIRQKKQHPFKTHTHAQHNDRVRAFIKIQEGCNFGCSFCITRLLRGKAKNKKEEQVLHQIIEKERLGFKEIIFTGTNILLYPDIHKLIKTVLEQSTISRIRFGSIDPRLITNNFIKLFHNSRLMPHIHLSLQSGSEKILRDMKRPIKISKIKNIVKKLRTINPLFNISADIIVGYPKETNADFQKTLKLAKDLKLSKIHYFPYSTRPKTPASQLLPLPNNTIKERLTEIKKLDKKLSLEAHKKIIGKKLPVLFEHNKNDIYYGYTPNFLRIKKKLKNNLTGKIKEIIIYLKQFDN